MIEKLEIKETFDTPYINFDPISGELRIEGKSYPANVTEFYEPIFNWLNEYFKQPAFETVLHLKLDYFNTASSKILMDLLYKLEEINHLYNHRIKIIWYYPEDDEDIYETGLEYSDLVNLPFELKSYKFIAEN